MPVQVIKSATFDAHVPNATAVTLTDLSRANGIYDLLTTGLNVTSKLTTVTADKKLVFVPKLVVDAPTLITVKTGTFAGTYRVKTCVFDGDKSIIEVFETPETFVETNGLTDDVMITGLGFVKNVAPAFQTGTNFFYFSIKPNRLMDVALEFKLNTCTIPNVVGECTVNVQGKVTRPLCALTSLSAGTRQTMRQFFKEFVSDGNSLYYSVSSTGATSFTDITSGAVFQYNRACLNGIILSNNAYYLENIPTNYSGVTVINYPPIACGTNTINGQPTNWCNAMACLSDNSLVLGSTSLSSGANWYVSSSIGSGVAANTHKSTSSGRFKFSSFATLCALNVMNHAGSLIAIERQSVMTAGVTYNYENDLVYCSEMLHYYDSSNYDYVRFFSLRETDWVR